MSLKKTWTVLFSTQSTSVENTPVHSTAVLGLQKSSPILLVK